MKFPGIGGRQAKRFVYFLLDAERDFINEFTDSLSSLGERIHRCDSCYRLFEDSIHKEKENTENTFCSICNDPNSDRSILLIVEKDVDFENIKKSDSYSGQYFILGGVISLTKQKDRVLRSQELIKNIHNKARGGELREIVIALSANPEGDATTTHLMEILSPLVQKYSLKISILGRGLSTGTELEYSDSDTIKNALENRR